MKETGRNGLAWSLLSTYRSQIMGAAIIWIMLMHGLELFPHMMKSVPVIEFILKRGMLGVEMFLLVSGIGLYFSASKNGNVKEFYIKRMNRVLIPYILISLPFWIWQDIWLKKDVSSFFWDLSLLSFWKDGYRKLWYVALIIPIYAIYPLIYKLFLKKRLFMEKSVYMLIGLLLPFIVYAVNPSYFEMTEIAFWRISSFVLGGVLAAWVLEEQGIGMKHILILGGITVGIIAIVVVVNHTIKVPGVFRLAYLPIGLICCISISVVLKLINSSLLNRFLGAAGTYSFELYMIHIFLRSVYRYYMPEAEGLTALQEIAIWCLIMCISALLGILAHKCLEHVKIRYYSRPMSRA